MNLKLTITDFSTGFYVKLEPTKWKKRTILEICIVELKYKFVIKNQKFLVCNNMNLKLSLWLRQYNPLNLLLFDFVFLWKPEGLRYNRLLHSPSNVKLGTFTKEHIQIWLFGSKQD